MCHLQTIYEKYKDKGMVLLGFNCSDDRGIARGIIRENGVTFPNIRDGSRAAWKVMFHGYKGGGVPLNYVIDRAGKVVDAWYGNDAEFSRARAALQKAGLEMEETPVPGARQQ